MTISTPGNGAQVSQETLNAGQVPHKLGGTQTEPQGDESLEATLAELKQAKEAREKLENDLNRMKSSLQSQLSQEKNRWAEERQLLEAERDELLKKGLDAEGQLQYDLQREREKRKNAEALAAQRQQDFLRVQEEQANYNAWYAKFTGEMGIPDSALDKSSLDAMYQSGMNYVAQKMQEMNNPATPPATPPQTPPGTPPQQPHQVHVQGGQGASGYVDFNTYVNEHYDGNEDAMFSDPNFDPHTVFPGMFPR